MMPERCVLIDLENIVPAIPSPQECHAFGDKVLVYVFIGPSQKLSARLNASLKETGWAVNLVQVKKTDGKKVRNALDFYIAFYAGQILKENPLAHVHIISRDRGFDPLVEHSKESGWSVCRGDRIDFTGAGGSTNLASVDAAQQDELADAGGQVCQALESKTAELVLRIKRGKRDKLGRPKTLRSLYAYARCIWKGEVKDDEFEYALRKMREAQLILNEPMLAADIMAHGKTLVLYSDRMEASQPSDPVAAQTPVNKNLVNKAEALITHIKRHKSGRPKTMKSLYACARCIWKGEVKDNEFEYALRKMREAQLILNEPILAADIRLNGKAQVLYAGG